MPVDCMTVTVQPIIEATEIFSYVGDTGEKKTIFHETEPVRIEARWYNNSTQQVSMRPTIFIDGTKIETTYVTNIGGHYETQVSFYIFPVYRPIGTHTVTPNYNTGTPPLSCTFDVIA